jgi:protein gp37
VAENSGIEWTHHTFNPWWGCFKVSPGCDNCYAERDAHRFYPGSKLWGTDTRREFGAKHWGAPAKWDRAAAAAGVRARVFCASMADVFDKDGPEGARAQLWQTIRSTPNLDWLLLTKRIGNAARMLPPDWGAGYPNAWLGASIVNQDEADRDIPKLLRTPGAVRFLSMEPLLSRVDLMHILLKHAEYPERGQPDVTFDALRGWHGGFESGRTRVDWVIVGGESGPNARPIHPLWAASLRNQCNAAGVPFFFKQWGEWFPGGQVPAEPRPLDSYRRRWVNPLDGSEEMHPASAPVYQIGKKAAGGVLDGQVWHQFPEGTR